MSDTSGTPSNIQPTAHGHFDLTTGKHYDTQGNEITPGLDPVAQQELAKLLGPRTATLVGNQADLQVSGAKQAEASDSGTELPSSNVPLVHTDDQQAPEQVPPAVAPAGEQLVAKVDFVPASQADAPIEAPNGSAVEGTPVPGDHPSSDAQGNA